MSVHGCISSPCTLCHPPPPMRVEHLVCPCNTWSDFPQPCGHHQPQYAQYPQNVWSSTDRIVLSAEDHDRVLAMLDEGSNPAPALVVLFQEDKP